jgi:hypothetical protein
MAEAHASRHDGLAAAEDLEPEAEAAATIH